MIRETFEEMGMVSRMGGDEFIAIVNTAKEEKVAELINWFQENIQRKNQKVQDLNMSIAWGYASGSSEEADIEKVYQAADDRMYECKKQMKSAKVGGAV